MDVAAMSVMMNQGKVMQQVDLSLLKKAMNSSEENGNAMIKMLEQANVQAPHPYLGQALDIRG